VRGDQEEPFTQLGDAVVCSLEHRERWPVVRPLSTVDLVDAPKQKLQTLILAAVRDAVDVLEQEGLRQRVLEDAEVGSERVSARIFEPLGVAARPVPRL
jgi:hypothetical protein